MGTIGPVAIADEGHSGATAEDSFFGLIDADGISAIKISNTGGGIEVDHLQYGQSNTNPVPEPSTLLLLGSGLVGLAGMRRRFKAKG